MGAESMSRDRVKFYNSIGFRLSALIATVIFLAVTVLSAFNAQQSLTRETENYRDLVRGAASAYAASVADAVVDRDRITTLSSLRGIRDLPNVVQTDITLETGQIFAELGSGAWIVSADTVEQSLWRTNNIRIDVPIVKSGSEVARLGMLVSIAPLRTEIVHNLLVTIMSSLVVSLLGIGIAQLFVARLTAPIRALTNAMGDFRGGDARQALDLRKRKDETGILTQSFEDMVDRIAERDQQITHHVETLEETVEERTLDLRVAKEDAEAANAAKSDFLATMSHEIRTPMNGMMVMAEMLGAADLTPRHRRYAEIIHRSGSSLLTIINDILDLSKIEAGHLDLESIPVSPENLVADIASLFWERARGKQLDLATYVSPNVPVEILADPTRLNQVISNLVNNALKFTDEGGVLIRIDAVPSADDHCEIVFEIMDTGIGIPEDKIDHIFESFSQADQSTTRRFGGTGLGLSVCQRLVTAMDGEIKVTSQPGRGSTFAVRFPAPVSRPTCRVSPVQLRIGTRLNEGAIKASLEQTLQDRGCEIVDQNPDFWITCSDLIAPAIEPNVLLTDVGDTLSDTLLQDGRALDRLPNPFVRTEIAALLARAQSGEFLGAEAVQGKGATLTLPSFEGLRILAADDNAVNREVLREALATLKAEATFVEDGAQAVNVFQREAFDLVFMDGSMPVLDGFEATRRIREIEADQSRTETPVYALTAQVAGTSENAWITAGANGHILKPFTLEKLSEVMAGLATGSQNSEPEIEPISASPMLLDQETISTLEQLGDTPGGVREKVWTMFNQKAANMLSELHSLMDAGAIDQIATQAHAFKSMALSSGLRGLADELQRIEALAKEGDLSSADPVTKKAVAKMVSNTQAEMERYTSRAA